MHESIVTKPKATTNYDLHKDHAREMREMEEANGAAGKYCNFTMHKVDMYLHTNMLNIH
jgi:hypothetical protein